jgi:hypothetical protein
MGFVLFSLKNWTEEGAVAKRLLKPVFLWARGSWFKRLLVLSLYCLIFLTGYYLLIQALIAEIREHDNQVSKERNWIVEASLYQATIDFAELCLKPATIDKKNAFWYCEKALQLYKKNNKGTLPELRKEIVKRKAYGAMVADMKSQLRRIKLDRVDQISPAIDWLDRILSRTGMVLTLLLALFGILAFVYGLYWRSDNSESNEPEASSSNT